jgi:trypsin
MIDRTPAPHLLWLLLGVLLFCLGCPPLAGCTRPAPVMPGGGSAAGGAPSAGAGGAGGAPVVCRATVSRTPRARTLPRAARPRIVGGQPSAPGVWPFAAALQTKAGFQFCGATLISPSWVLTAGHCEVSPGELAVLDRVDLRQSNGEAIEINEVRTHEWYAAADIGWDVAVAHLSRPALTAPAGLAPSGWQGPGLLAEVVGWGLTSEYAQGTSPIQRDTQIPILAEEVCAGAYRSFPATALCAGYAEGGRDSCQGDSGGPLLVQQGAGWAVAGITSFGEGCARPGRPGVYTAVAAVRSWIDACAPEAP